MSDKCEGPGWWIASDGKWYPPELHPAVRAQIQTGPPEQPGGHATARSGPEAGPPSWQSHDSGVPGGRQFPDLFQKALEGSHLVDNVTVKYDGDDQRNVPATASAPSSRPTAGTGTGTGSRVPVAAGTAGVTFGAPAPTKRKWRKGH